MNERQQASQGSDDQHEADQHVPGVHAFSAMRGKGAASCFHGSPPFYNNPSSPSRLAMRWAARTGARPINAWNKPSAVARLKFPLSIPER